MTTSTTNNEIVSVTSPSGEIRETRRFDKNGNQLPSVFVKISKQIGSDFAVLISKQLRKASRTRREAMMLQLAEAGITEINGWSINELIRGRLNRETGERQYPDGSQVKPSLRAPELGIYYGAIPQVPVTELYQHGVVWSPAS